MDEAGRSWTDIAMRFRWYEKVAVPAAWGGVFAIAVALVDVWPPTRWQWFSALAMVATAGLVTVLALFRASARGGGAVPEDWG